MARPLMGKGPRAAAGPSEPERRRATATRPESRMRPPLLPSARSRRRTALLALLPLVVAACLVDEADTPADSVTAADSAPLAAGTPADSPLAAVGPDDSTAALADSAAGDSLALALSPERPMRGGVLVAVAARVTDRSPRCTWRGEPLPCHATAGGARAIVPLPAELEPGTYPLVIEGGGARAARQVTVADTTFERSLVFLAPPQFALLGRRADVARDARAVQQVLARESDEQRWDGAWREPVAGLRGAEGFGAERFYYAASDSARAVQLRPEMRAAGAFGTDSAATPTRAGAAASWRHAGLDVATPAGTAVRAPAGGVVSDVGQYVLTGGTLVIDHGHGVSSAYFHLDSALVQKGDVVRAGQQVARSGNTGLTTGPHLHYGVYVHGQAVNPRLWHDATANVRRATRTDTTAAAPATRRP